MKLIGLSVLLSIALLTSTAYLVMHQSSGELQKLENDEPTDPCLFFDIKQIGHAYPTWDQYAQNICQKPTRFIIVYKSVSLSPETVFVSSCLQQNQEEKTPLVYTFSTIKSIIHEEC